MLVVAWGENSFGQVSRLEPQLQATRVAHPVLHDLTPWPECDELIAASWSQVIIKCTGADPTQLNWQGLPLSPCDHASESESASSPLKSSLDLRKVHFLGHDSFLAVHSTQDGRVYSIDHLERSEEHEERQVTQEGFVLVEMNMHGGVVTVHTRKGMNAPLSPAHEALTLIITHPCTCPLDSTHSFEYRYYPTLSSLFRTRTPTPITSTTHYQLLTLPSPSFHTQSPIHLISSTTTDHFTLLLSPSQTVLTFSPSRDNRFSQLGIPPSIPLVENAWVHVDSLDGLYIHYLSGPYALTKEGTMYHLPTGEMVEFRSQAALEMSVEPGRIQSMASGSGWAVASDEEGKVWVRTEVY
ncbi:BQ2448_1506 [Microbotryum intermedium]|uniref:BQ2448_1506 protein n=1 Tax=Microbotryum intermedium TaxID=269621 RepID=A0A238F8B7_9BASI|nr:BQ2448_1506 [Microbotryum intermedium]